MRQLSVFDCCDTLFTLRSAKKGERQRAKAKGRGKGNAANHRKYEL